MLCCRIAYINEVAWLENGVIRISSFKWILASTNFARRIGRHLIALVDENGGWPRRCDV